MKEKKKGKSRIGRSLRKLGSYRKEKKSVFIVYVTLRIIVIACLILAILNGDIDSAFICLLVLVLFLVPAFLQENFDVRFPTTLEIIILLFVFAAEMLGELSSFYVHFKYWDTLLHTTWGFLCAAVGFSLVEILNREKRIQFELSPAFLALVAFCFSMTIGVIWEFFEFGMDYLFHMDMQKDTVIHAFASTSLDPTLSNIAVRVDNITDVAVNGESLGLGGYLDIGLYDTMEDLFVNFVGALVFSIIGFFNAKSKGKSKIASQFIPQLAEDKQEETPGE
ncbi:MAG: hypothetical protein ACI4PC_05330 [Oscillospiraceae bacterium]